MSDLDRYWEDRNRRNRPRLPLDPATLAEELAWACGGVRRAAELIEEVLEELLELVAR